VTTNTATSPLIIIIIKYDKIIIIRIACVPGDNRKPSFLFAAHFRHIQCCNFILLHNRFPIDDEYNQRYKTYFNSFVSSESVNYVLQNLAYRL